MTEELSNGFVGADGRRSTDARPPELLAPAGDWDCARAAIENGADAIYFGLEKFNARMRANNFTEADLPRLVAFLHARGVRGYLSFNTLVFPDELAEAERLLRVVVAAGVDAAIVQDVGICRMIRGISPDFPIHASTQMTITSAAGVAFARELGCHRVILAREVPVAEIEKIHAAGAAASSAGGSSGGLPLEVFVHGALCVAYSGQCLTSEALGGRSANRGICAQACRMPFELVADGKPVDLGDRRYLLSPQDLVGLEMLPELMRVGVASLKIEGRLKTPEYVANITRVYREAVDRVFAESQAAAGDPTGVARALFESHRYELEMAFSRGLHTGWLRGIDNRQLVHGRYGKKRGVFLGEVTQVRRHEVQARLVAPVKPGDGVVFDAGRPDLEEEGGRVYEIAPANPRKPERQGPPQSSEVAHTILRFGKGDVDFPRVHVGDRLWKTSDPELERKWRQSYAGSAPRFQQPLDFEVFGRVGQPLRLVARDDAGHAVELESAMPLVPADRRPLSLDRMRDQLGRLGGTSFRLGELASHLEGDVLLPVSELNRLRRNAVARLESLRARPAQWTLLEPEGDVLARRAAGTRERETGGETAAAPELIALVRDLAQLEAATGSRVTTVYCDFADPRKYREAVERFRNQRRSESSPGASVIYVAPPRIHKMGEVWILDQVRSCGADGFLVRNHDHLGHFAGQRCIGDFSLNVANAVAAEHFLRRYGLERVTASYDLNHAELVALLQSMPPSTIEITLHQHMPMFHMEHCVLCAFLSRGTDYRDCGRPCDGREVRLRDRAGIAHPVVADVACRNTVFNARAQTGAEHARTFLSRGARHFRLEFLDESPDLVQRTIGRYRQMLCGSIPGTQLWRELQLFNQLGVTRGPVG